MTATYAVVPTAGRECTTSSLASIAGQVDETYVIWTAPDTEVPDEIRDLAHIVRAPGKEKNISAWWNTGLALAATHAAYAGHSEWNTLVMNDDVIAPAHLTTVLDVAMRSDQENVPTGPDDVIGHMRAERHRLFPGVRPTLVYPNAFDDRWVLNTRPGPVDLHTRITGWCFMLRGEDWLMCDPLFRWWYGDDDLDWSARLRGGALCVPGCAVTHLYPGQLTSESAELTSQTHTDREAFALKWAGVPH